MAALSPPSVDVLSASVPPASPLRLMELTDRYAAPPGKVREALLQLASEGLIQFKPKHGFASLPVSLEELWDVTRLRIRLESEALTQAIECGDETWEANIISTLHLLSNVETRSLKDRRALDGAWKRHRQFHSALLSACQSKWTTKFCEILSDHAERYRRHSITVRSHARDIHAEHKAIAEAAIARNAKRASKLLAGHYMSTANAVAANGDAFMRQSERAQGGRR
jgi:GntR family transcriptional regulator, carbon starvation induced regulator